MTREEAIKILADLTDNLFLHTWEEQYKALHMAIEALSADAKGGDADIPINQSVMQQSRQADMVLVDLNSKDGYLLDGKYKVNGCEDLTNGRAEVVRCKDCRHANECHKNVQYTHNEQSTITIGYTPIEWCSRGERREE